MKFAIILLSVLFYGCGEGSPEKHITSANGVERGIEIEVMLKGGGTATLVCPKFDHEPRSAHGRECYLREYDYVKAHEPTEE